MEDRQAYMDRLERAAAEGDPEAMAQLGVLLASGDAGRKDLPEAHRLLRAAAAAGDLNAMFNLGVLHEKGIGTPPDLDEAALWFWQAAEGGDAGAKVRLGTMLLRGRGFSAGSAVLRSIEASAESGRPYAQAFLGRLLQEGAGVEQSDARSEHWFRLAAHQGEETAASNLLEMFTEGRTAETSEDELASWFFELGVSHLRRRDMVRAFDCLVSIKRAAPRHFLAQRLEGEIERANLPRNGGH